MPELIYRDVAKFQACNWKVKSNDDAIFDSIKESIKRLLDLAPAVDAVPVVHGEWIEKRYRQPVGEDGYINVVSYFCSVCDGEHYYGNANYCPNCGAKMDGEAKEGE